MITSKQSATKRYFVLLCDNAGPHSAVYEDHQLYLAELVHPPYIPKRTQNKRYIPSRQLKIFFYRCRFTSSFPYITYIALFYFTNILPIGVLFGSLYV